MCVYMFLVVFWPFSLTLCVFYSRSAYSVSVIQVFLRFTSLSGVWPLCSS